MSNWEETWDRPRTRWRDYISKLAWERLGIPLDVATEWEVVTRLRLLAPTEIKMDI